MRCASRGHVRALATLPDPQVLWCFPGDFGAGSRLVGRPRWRCHVVRALTSAPTVQDMLLPIPTLRAEVHIVRISAEEETVQERGRKSACFTRQESRVQCDLGLLTSVRGSPGSSTSSSLLDSPPPAEISASTRQVELDESLSWTCKTASRRNSRELLLTFAT